MTVDFSRSIFDKYLRFDTVGHLFLLSPPGNIKEPHLITVYKVGESFAASILAEYIPTHEGTDLLLAYSDGSLD